MYNNENYGNGFGPTEEKKEQNIPNVDAEGGEVKAESGAAYTEGSTGFSENTESASYNKQENRENTAGGAYGARTDSGADASTAILHRTPMRTPACGVTRNAQPRWTIRREMCILPIITGQRWRRLPQIMKNRSVRRRKCPAAPKAFCVPCVS